jgi:hypothetical protein
VGFYNLFFPKKRFFKISLALSTKGTTGTYPNSNKDINQRWGYSEDWTKTPRRGKRMEQVPPDNTLAKPAHLHQGGGNPPPTTPPQREGTMHPNPSPANPPRFADWAML